MVFYWGWVFGIKSAGEACLLACFDRCRGIFVVLMGSLLHIQAQSLLLLLLQDLRSWKWDEGFTMLPFASGSACNILSIFLAKLGFVKQLKILNFKFHC